jgi:hypothetical protein
MAGVPNIGIDTSMRLNMPLFIFFTMNAPEQLWLLLVGHLADEKNHARFRNQMLTCTARRDCKST